MVTEIGILLFIWISIGVDCSKVHKEVIDFLQLEADGLILAGSLALEISQSHIWLACDKSL